MNTTRTDRNHGLIPALMAVALLLGAAPAYAEEPALKRLISSGRDGDKNYFTAVCRDGRRASVVEDRSSGQTCATSLSGEARCRKDWRLMEAGTHACTVKKGS